MPPELAALFEAVSLLNTLLLKMPLPFIVPPGLGSLLLLIKPQARHHARPFGAGRGLTQGCLGPVVA